MGRRGAGRDATRLPRARPARARAPDAWSSPISRAASSFSLPLTVAAILLGAPACRAFILAWRRKALGKPLLVVRAMVVGGALAASLGAIVANLLRPGDYWRAFPLIAYLALYALLLLAMAVLRARFGSGMDRERMRAAAWLLILLVGGAASLALPGATILFLLAPALATSV